MPATFAVPQVTPGWQQGIILTGAGDTMAFAMSATFGYGLEDPPVVPGGATLLFEVEWLAVAPAQS